MTNLINYAYQEFRAAGWCDQDNQFNNEMQQAICNHVIKLLEVFSNQGHSGSSAPYAVQLFSKMALFDPLTPLTGADDEWQDVTEFSNEPTWQNKRCSRVFKNVDGQAFDIEGVVFYNWVEDEDGKLNKTYFSSMSSRIPVQFPYTPTVVYKEYIDPNTAS